MSEISDVILDKCPDRSALPLATVGTQELRKPSGTGIHHVMMRGIRSAMPLATVGTQESPEHLRGLESLDKGRL